MNNAPVNQTLASIARLIAESNDFTLIMHVSPDGDAIGSACALRLALMYNLHMYHIQTSFSS